MDDVEIEIKVHIEKSKPLIDFLEKNARFKAENHQIDEYFSPAHRNFTSVRPVNEWLRLRDSGGKFFINYKNWYQDKEGRTSHCVEYETRVEDLAKLKKILNVLNFKYLATVDKLRKTWVYKDYEIDIDSVKGLGDFVEIEHIGGDKKVDPKEITEEMISFLKEIDCGKIERDYAGYPFRLLFPNESKFEEY